MLFHESVTGYQSPSSWSSIALPEDMQHSAWAIPLSGERSYALWDSRSHRARFLVRTGSAMPTVLAMRTFTNSGRTAHLPGYEPSQGSWCHQSPSFQRAWRCHRRYSRESVIKPVVDAILPLLHRGVTSDFGAMAHFRLTVLVSARGSITSHLDRQVRAGKMHYSHAGSVMPSCSSTVSGALARTLAGLRDLHLLE
jgi:hypothetical protein